MVAAARDHGPGSLFLLDRDVVPELPADDCHE
jgi:hypothetical protein